jgi:hypothetical protein
MSARPSSFPWRKIDTPRGGAWHRSAKQSASCRDSMWVHGY